MRLKDKFTHSVLWGCDNFVLICNYLLYIAWSTFISLSFIPSLIWLFHCWKYFYFFFQSEVFAVAFALLAAGAVILTLNVLLLVTVSFSLTLLSSLVFITDISTCYWKHTMGDLKHTRTCFLIPVGIRTCINILEINLLICV